MQLRHRSLKWQEAVRVSYLAFLQSRDIVHNAALYRFVCFCLAELSIDNRAEVTSNERRSCNVRDSSEDKMTEALNHNGSVDEEGSHYNVTVSQQEPSNHLVCAMSTSAPLLPGSAIIRHSASDSLVYRADVQLASSCDDGQQTEQTTGVNGCLKAADETSLSQVGFKFRFDVCCYYKIQQLL